MIHPGILVQVVIPGRRWHRVGTLKIIMIPIVHRYRRQTAATPSTSATLQQLGLNLGLNLESQLHSRAMSGCATHGWRSMTTLCKPAGGLTDHPSHNDIRPPEGASVRRLPWNSTSGASGPPGACISPHEFHDSRRSPSVVSSSGARSRILSAYIRWLTKTVYAKAFGALVEEAGNMNFEVRSKP